MHTFSMQTIKEKIKLSIKCLATAVLAVVFLTPTSIVKASTCAFTIRAGNKTFELSDYEIGWYQNTPYVKCLEGVVDRVFYETASFPTDAKISFNPNLSTPFSYTSEVMGKGVCKEKLINDINFALKNGKKVVNAEFIDLEPSVTVNDLKKYTFKMGEYSTFYGSSSENRKYNVKLACQKINGKILSPNEVFSFNQAVGKRSEENGFKSATVIENGEFSEGVGGGVCQVSTTLYNCALLSGLEVKERHPHSIVPAYVEPSFDAMVSGEVCDLKFVNNTSGNVYVKAIADGNDITFTFYGEKPTSTYKRVSETLETIPAPETEIIKDDTMLYGESETIKQSKNGLKSSAYLYVTNKGVTRAIRLHTDSYKPIKGKIRVGTLAMEDTEPSFVDKSDNVE